jgi:multiple sugar transport system permease protein
MNSAKQRALPVSLLLPAFLLVIGIMLYPLFYAFQLSFLDVKLYDMANRTWIGLRNYVEVLTDPLFVKVMQNSVIFVGLSILGQVGFGFALASVLNRPGMRGRRVFRAIYILPWVASPLVMSYAWRFFYNPRIGLLNYVLGLVGISAPDWLGDLGVVMISMVIANIWRGTPFSFVLQTAGIQSIPYEVYDAAKVDGASGSQTLVYITLPLMKYFIIMNLIMVTMYTFNSFEAIMIMTGGGPLYATEVLSLHMYHTAFDYGLLGQGSALAVILFLVNLAFTVFYVRKFRI